MSGDQRVPRKRQGGDAPWGLWTATPTHALWLHGRTSVYSP